MSRGLDREKYQRLWRIHGGPRGRKAIRPPHNLDEWTAGSPVHWIEQTAFMHRKSLFIRFFSFLQLAVGMAYLQYRARHTIGIFEKSATPPYLAYQIFFFVLEIISYISIIFRMLEAWNVTHRNCIDLRRIPNDLIVPRSTHSSRTRVPPQFCNYPSVAIFIPCYNEDVDLVTETVIAALNIDYPSQLLTIYLCDDGKDIAKRSVISQLRHQHRNVHYVIRPQNNHAKAGNLNYAIERTNSDLIVTLDADFVARPNLLQRLIPYYFVWNPTIGMYEFNETLAYVQTPQFFRNLSPYDSDPLDQRGIFFNEVVLPGKDWFNASTMVGTTNLINRAALKKANYYPYHSITEDSALSIIFHGLGFRSYFVNESLATGLATTSLWANLRQRARWLKGDWQILFSKYGPVSQKGLNIIQRLLYLNMAFARIISIVHTLYDVVVVLLLTLHLSPLDVKDPIIFIIYLGAYLSTSVIYRYVIGFGGGGLDKSEAGNVAFEAIFRYTTVKGLFIALFRGDKLTFKVTDKPGLKRRRKNLEKVPESNDVAERFVENPRGTVLGQPGPGMEAYGVEQLTVEGEGLRSSQDVAVGAGSGSVSLGEYSGNEVTQVQMPPPAVVLDVNSTRRETIRSASSSEESVSIEDDDGRSFKKRFRSRTVEERQERRRDIRKNLKRTWFNSLMTSVLIFAIVWGIAVPPKKLLGSTADSDGNEELRRYDNLLPTGLALGFAMCNLLPHLLAIYLCFIPYLSGWVMSDLVHGRCDQWAVHPKTGRLFVPFSFISLLSLARVLLIVGSVSLVTVASLLTEDGAVTGGGGGR